MINVHLLLKLIPLMCIISTYKNSVLRVLRTNKRYPLEKYIHLMHYLACAIVELKLSFKHIMFGNKCERQ
jgi:hypothetical protein